MISLTRAAQQKHLGGHKGWWVKVKSEQFISCVKGLVNLKVTHSQTTWEQSICLFRFPNFIKMTQAHSLKSKQFSKTCFEKEQSPILPFFASRRQPCSSVFIVSFTFYLFSIDHRDVTTLISFSFLTYSLLASTLTQPHAPLSWEANLLKHCMPDMTQYNAFVPSGRHWFQCSSYLNEQHQILLRTDVLITLWLPACWQGWFFIPWKMSYFFNCSVFP